MEEVSTYGPEGAQEKAAHMNQLYPALLQMPVVVWAEGRGEEYVVSVPAHVCMDDHQQMVEDNMIIHNRNFIQSAELVSLQLLCTVLVLFSSNFLILMCYFTGYYDYSKHDQPTSRVPVSVGG